MKTTRTSTTRKVIYSGDNQNLQSEQGRDIITLYVFCGLGYSPIRHILGMRNDKRIEDVVRQHNLGRNNVLGDKGELVCPIHKTLTDEEVTVIKTIALKYDTYGDTYVMDMVDKKTWYDDPVSSNIEKCVCGEAVSSEWEYCPHCGTKLYVFKSTEDNRSDLIDLTDVKSTMVE